VLLEIKKVQHLPQWFMVKQNPFSCSIEFLIFFLVWIFPSRFGFEFLELLGWIETCRNLQVVWADSTRARKSNLLTDFEKTKFAYIIFAFLELLFRLLAAVNTSLTCTEHGQFTILSLFGVWGVCFVIRFWFFLYTLGTFSKHPTTSWL
jgi:hypothetical protein